MPLMRPLKSFTASCSFVLVANIPCTGMNSTLQCWQCAAGPPPPPPGAAWQAGARCRGLFSASMGVRQTALNHQTKPVHTTGRQVRAPFARTLLVAWGVHTAASGGARLHLLRPRLGAILVRNLHCRLPCRVRKRRLGEARCATAIVHRVPSAAVPLPTHAVRHSNILTHSAAGRRICTKYCCVNRCL